MKKYITACLMILFNVASSELFTQWTQIVYTQYEAYGCTRFLNHNTGWRIGGLSIAKSTNGGLNWVTQASFATGVYPRWLHFVNANYGWVVCQDGNYLRTTNGGNNWILSSYPDSTHFQGVYFLNQITGWAVGRASFNGSILRDHVVIKTTSGGINWFPQVYDIYNTYNSVCFINQMTGWICGDNGRIMKTTNGGDNWALQFSGNNFFWKIYFVSNETGWVCGTVGSARLYKTTNGGLNWQPQVTGSSVYGLLDIFFKDSLKGWAVGQYNRIIATSNGGVNWIQQHLGTYDEILRSVCFVDDSVGWASGEFKIFKTTNGGVPVGITIINNNLPDKFSLSQNYPNPFNPQTKIKFAIPKASFTQLIIYDLLGREVATLVNEELRPGTYEADWDASSFSSGVYFYRIISGEFVETKKMVLMK